MRIQETKTMRIHADADPQLELGRWGGGGWESGGAGSQLWASVTWGGVLASCLPLGIMVSAFFKGVRPGDAPAAWKMIINKNTDRHGAAGRGG